MTWLNSCRQHLTPDKGQKRKIEYLLLSFDVLKSGVYTGV